jgi:hypothetical protein
MVRNNRLTLRIMLAAVLVAAVLGAWFATASVSIDAESFALPGLDEQTDWVDAASIVGEQLIQFFLGWTNAGGA